MHYPHWLFELCLFSENGREKLLALIKSVQDHIAEHPTVPLANLARTLSSCSPKTDRLAITATDPEDLNRKLNLVLDKLSNAGYSDFQIKNEDIFFATAKKPRPLPVKTAFLFPGYGSYYLGMLADLYQCFPSVKSWFDQLDEMFKDTPDFIPSELIVCSPTSLTSNQRERLTRYLTDFSNGAQCGLTASFALFEILNGLKIRSDVMVGHSNGENAALVASGVLHFQSKKLLLKAIHELSIKFKKILDRTPTGVFLSVSTLNNNSLKDLVNSFAGNLHLAMDNCPHQCVLFGSVEDIDKAAGILTSAGNICQRLPFNQPYHTSLFKTQEKILNETYNSLDFREGQTPLYSCSTAQPFPGNASPIRQTAIKQWTHQVQFCKTIENLYRNEGIRNFIEVGPNGTLTSFVDDTLREHEHFAISGNLENRSGLRQIQNLAAQMFIKGNEVDLDFFFNFRNVPKVDLFSSNFLSTGDQKNAAKMETNPFPQNIQTVDNKSKTSIENPRLKILLGYFELNRRFLDGQEKALELLSNNLNGKISTREKIEKVVQNKSPHDNDFPLLGKIIKIDSKQLYSERLFNIQTDLFLRDHTFGRKNQHWSADIFPLAVVPFSISMEIAAEAACFLAGDSQKIIRIAATRGHRWLTLDNDLLAVGISAEFIANGEIKVRLFDLGKSDGSEPRLAFEAIVHLEKNYQTTPPPKIKLRDEVSSGNITDEEFYGKFVFHGPCFQSFRKTIAVAKQGIEAELTIPLSENFFKSTQNPHFQTPAGLLDVAGQLVCLWLLENGCREFSLFPFYVELFEQYGAPIVSGEQIRSRVRIPSTTQTMTVADFEFIDKANQVRARLKGFQFRNYREPLVCKLFQLQNKFSNSNAFSVPFLQNETHTVCRRFNLASEPLLIDGQGIWTNVLAKLVLDDYERNFFSSLPKKGPRRTEWLIGRVVAKEAVCQWAQENAGIELLPISVRIESDKNGKPIVQCAALKAKNITPNISISHCEKDVVAVAIGTEHKIGIDIENITVRKSVDWLRNVFTASELEFVKTGTSTDLLPLWCVKEAASKALGTGLNGNPKNWEIIDYDPEAGKANVEYSGQQLSIRLFYKNELILAVCQNTRSEKKDEMEFHNGSFEVSMEESSLISG